MTNELQDQNTADQEQAAAAETHEAPEADAEVAEGEDTGEAANPDQQDDAPESARKNKGVGKRINELTREKHEAKRREEAAQREAEYWKRVALEKGGDREEPAKPAAAPEAGAKPRAEDFENYADFIEALTDWKTEERERQRANAARVQAAQQEQRRTQESLAQKIESARERFEDFDDVVGNPDLPITDHIAHRIAPPRSTGCRDRQAGGRAGAARQAENRVQGATARPVPCHRFVRGPERPRPDDHG
jgi:hypothetical protein